jgi:putative oxidoreductase
MKKGTESKGTWTKDVALFVLRLSGLGLAFAHGWPKITMFLAGEGGRFVQGVESMGFPYPAVFAWAAGLSELAGGVAITLGLLTRVAASFAAATMFVAVFFRHHLAQQLLAFIGYRAVSSEVLESWGSPEKAASYLLIFISLVFLGAGRLSLDRMLFKRG